MNKLTILFLIIFCCNAIAQPVLPLQVSTTPSCATTCSGMIDLDFAAQGFTVEDLQFQWTCLTNCNCEIVNDQEDLHNVASGTYNLWVHSISGCEGQYDFEVLGLSSAGDSDTPCIHPANSINDGGILLPYHEVYTYTWDGFPDSNGPALYPVPAGDYTVRIEGPAGVFPCSSEFTYTVPPCTPEDIILTPIATLQSSDNSH